MVATAELHTPEEAGIRILPALGPLTVDAVAEVRQSALAALEAFSAVLKQHSSSLDSVHQAAGGAAKDLAQGATTGSWSVGLGNNLGWASISSLTTKSPASASASPSGRSLAGSGLVAFHADTAMHSGRQQARSCSFHAVTGRWYQPTSVIPVSGQMHQYWLANSPLPPPPPPPPGRGDWSGLLLDLS